MNTDSEADERCATPVPGSSLDPDSPLVDSPIYPRSPRINMASKEEEEPFIPAAPVSEPPIADLAEAKMTDHLEYPANVIMAEPRDRLKKSPIPTPKPSPRPDSEFSSLARELEGYTWEQLQQRFVEAMDEQSRTELMLQRDTADLFDVFMIWSQTMTFHDEQRAYKRFKTRMDHVQQSEESLEEKKVHYTNVVRAFESALALLRTE